MTEITAFCFRHKKEEEVVKMVINNDGVTITLVCGYTMRKIFEV